jgi:hypothetical protein
MQKRHAFIITLNVKELPINQINQKTNGKEMTVKHTDIVTYSICGLGTVNRTYIT